MKEKLKFYNIDINYIKYLKQFDSKIPNIEYENHNKFVKFYFINLETVVRIV